MTSQILLFSQPRSASHMLERMFEKQDDLKIFTNPFSSSRDMQFGWMKTESYANGMTADTLSKFKAEVEKGNKNWRTQLAEAESKCQTLMIHTHLSYPLPPEVILRYAKSLREGPPDSATAENCTMIPDNLLLYSGTIPVFTIRDPRLAVPSAHRTMHLMGIEHGGGFLNYFSVAVPIWNRLMYDFYVSQGFNPLVIETDDYLTNMDFVRALCARLGLDPGQLNLSWSAATEAEKGKIHPMYYASQSTLINSSKPDPDRAGKNIDLENSMGDWDEEFGNDTVVMRELVELAKPHYEYLLDKKTKL